MMMIIMMMIFWEVLIFWYFTAGTGKIRLVINHKLISDSASNAPLQWWNKSLGAWG